MSKETCQRVNKLEMELEAKERELLELKLMLEVSRGKEESNYLETCEIHQANSNLKRLQNFYKSVIDDKDHTIQLLEEQLSFLKSAYGELEPQHSSISLEFIRDTITCILKRIPPMNTEIERMIDIVTSMLRVPVNKRQEIKDARRYFN